MKIMGGHEYDVIYLRPSQIKYAPYQRKIKQKKVEQISRNFNGDIFNQPDISYRDGCYWCIDGQHTIAAWQMLYGDKPVPCKVYRGMTYSEEAALFVAQNGITSPVTPIEFFNGKIEEGDMNMLNVLKGARKAGFDVPTDRRRGTGKIVAVNSLIEAYDMLGYKGYCDMLHVINTAWNGDADAIRGSMIGGMALFFKVYQGQFQCSELIKSLSKTTARPMDIINYAKVLGASHKRYIAKAILAKYNTKRSANRLEDKL